MDTNAKNVVFFLSCLQQAQARLGDLWQELRVRGCHPQRPYLVLSTSPFRVSDLQTVREFEGCVSLGLGVRGTDNNQYDLGVSVLWDDVCWTVMTQVWVDDDDGGQTLLSALPERSSTSLTACLAQIQEAIADLFCLHIDLVP